MVEYIKTKFIYDKEKIFRQLHLKESENVTNYTHQVFPSLIQLAMHHLEITTCYSVQHNHFRGILPGVEDCQYVVLCCCSCSQKIDDLIERMLKEEEFLDGFLLNHISNEILFNASNQMNTQLEYTLLEKDIHLTRKQSPGSCGIDLEAQAILLNALKQETDLDITLTSNFMLAPEKSMLYYYGADSTIETHSTKHDCNSCDSTDCPYRDADF